MRLSKEHAVGLAFVVVAHAALLWTLMQHRIIAMPESLEPLFVHFIEPRRPPEPKPEPPKPKVEPPKPVKLDKPRPPDPHPHLVVEAPAAPTDYVAEPPPPPPPAPVVVEAPPAPPPVPVGPVQLSGALSTSCPSNKEPVYPPLSQRRSESGKVVLRVELGVDGRVDSVRIESSSGFKRLDAAAVAVVKTWRCNPSIRGGQPVRAVALQPFNFKPE